MHCQKCLEAHYIGATGGNFSYRFNNDAHSITHKISLPLHFNEDDHNINDHNVCILKGDFKDTKHRKLTGLLFIIMIKTNKFGLNKDISFLSRCDAYEHKGIYLSSSHFTIFSWSYISTPTFTNTCDVALSLHEFLSHTSHPLRHHLRITRNL